MCFSSSCRLKKILEIYGVKEKDTPMPSKHKGYLLCWNEECQLSFWNTHICCFNIFHSSLLKVRYCVRWILDQIQLCYLTQISVLDRSAVVILLKCLRFRRNTEDYNLLFSSLHAHFHMSWRNLGTCSTCANRCALYEQSNNTRWRKVQQTSKD